MSTHHLCFRAKIRKNVFPCIPQIHYIKVGCKGVFVTRTCFHDAASKSALLTFHEKYRPATQKTRQRNKNQRTRADCLYQDFHLNKVSRFLFKIGVS